MSNWSTYQQKISPAFRNVAQAIQNHYTANDISFEIFDAKSAEDIESDLQSITADSPIYLEYARSILSYAILTPAEYGSAEGLKFSMLTRDQEHYDEIESHLSSVYTDFTVLQSEVAEDLAAQIYTAAASSDFLLELGEMLVAVKSLTIWERFKLSFSMLEDKEAEHLVNMLNDSEEANINSFRVLSQLSSSGLAAVIEAFSASNIYLNSVASGIQSRAKVIYTLHGESDPNADLWNEYYESLPAAKKSPIELLKETGSISTVYELANMEFSSLVALLSVDVFNLLAPYYLSASNSALLDFSFTYRFIGRLMNDETEPQPLYDWKVSTTDENDTEFGSIGLGTTRSNANGYFEVYFNTLSELSSTYALEFEITDSDAGTVSNQTKNFDPTQPEEVVEFQLTDVEPIDSALIESTDPEIVTVSSEDENLSIPTALSTYLSTNAVNYLADIRKIGGLLPQGDLPQDQDVLDAAAILDAHANLELVKGEKDEATYIAENKQLIQAGYNSILDIAEKDRYSFVADTKTVFSTGQYGAGQLHEQAKTVKSFTSELINGGLGNGFKNIDEEEVKASLNALKSKSCACDDCQSGVSPLAYLADLTNYALRVVKNNDTDISLTDLQDLFLHPFDKLPADCSSVKKHICQVRASIEVLWTFIQKQTASNTHSSSQLTTAADLKALRLKTYEYLLDELGTSHEELRTVIYADTVEKEKFAERLGIPVDEIENISLEYSSNEAADEITDEKLEELFGFRDTTRNFKELDGTSGKLTALDSIATPELQTIKEAKLRADFAEEDFEELPYTLLGLPIIDPDVITPNDFRKTSTSVFDLWQKRFNWLGETIESLKESTIQRATFPEERAFIVDAALSMSENDSVTLTGADQTDHIVTVVKSESLKNGQTKVYTIEALPLNLDSTDSIEYNSQTYQPGGVEVPNVSDDSINATPKDSVFKKMINAISYPKDGGDVNETPWTGIVGTDHETYFELFHSNLKTKSLYAQTVQAIKDDLGLTEKEFLRLYSLYQKNTLARGTSIQSGLSDEEWNDLINILMISVKNRFIQDWIEEETALGLSITSDHFWRALSRPLMVEQSPLINSSGQYDLGDSKPLVDPQLINASSLPDIVIGSAAKTLYEDRTTELDQSLKTLRSTREAEATSNEGFDELMIHVFGSTLGASTEIDDTAADLADQDETISFAAQQKVINSYKMRLEDFSFLIGLKAKAAKNLVAEQPSAEEWTSLYNLLLSPYKIINLYGTWKSHEQSNYFVVNGSVTDNLTWKLHKVGMPKWRATEERRRAFEKELEIKSKPVIIDPYVIEPVNIKGLTAANLDTHPIYQVWKTRREELDAYRDLTISSLDGTSDFQIMNSRISTHLGVSISYTGTPGNWEKQTDDLADIQDLQNAGESIADRLDRIGLTRDGFKRLMELRDLVMPADPPALTEQEKEDVANILVNGYKPYKFSEWHEDEEDLAIDLSPIDANAPFALSPEYFQEEPLPAFSFPPEPPVEKEEFQFDARAFKTWMRKLEKRQRQWQAVEEDLKEVVKNAEKLVLIDVRNAIIQHLINASPTIGMPEVDVPAEGSNPATTRKMTLDEAQEWISRHLLIDAKMNCCSPTTRATQAIEALQVLLWGMNNELILDEINSRTGYDLNLNAEDFEAEWKWIGSYATWRAAMFVQLYPENILMPELLPNPSLLMSESVTDLRQVKDQDSIKKVYKNHFDRLRQFTDLNVKASCRLISEGDLISENTPFNINDLGTVIDDESTFIIAQSAGSDKYCFQEIKSYTSTNDILESDWVGIPEVVGQDFIGISSYHDAYETSVFLFTSESIKEDTQVNYYRYDVLLKRWGAKEILLNISDVDNIQCFVDQSNKADVKPSILICGVNIDQSYYMQAFVFDKKNKPRILEQVTETVDNWKDVVQSYTEDSRWEPGNGTITFHNIGDPVVKRPVIPKYFYYDHYEDEYILVGYSRKFRAHYYRTENSVLEPKFEKFDNKWVKWTLSGKTLTRRPGGISAQTQNWKEERKYEIEKFSSTLDDSVNLIPVLIDDNQIINLLFDQDNNGVQELEDTLFYNATFNLKASGTNIVPSYHLYNISVDDKIFVGQSDTGTMVFQFEANKNNTSHKIAQVTQFAFNIYSISALNFNNLSFGESQSQIFDKEELELWFSANSNQLTSELASEKVIKMVKEMFYDLPQYISNKLIKLNEFEESKKYLSAIYDFEVNDPIYYMLLDQLGDLIINDNWKDQPLNPHDIAASRSGTLKRSFYLQLVNYFLTYANHEFTQDTIESIAKAKQLYLEALELIQEIKGDETNCNEQIRQFSIDIESTGDQYWISYWKKIKERLFVFNDLDELPVLLEDIGDAWDAGGDIGGRIMQIEGLVDAAFDALPGAVDLGTEMSNQKAKVLQAMNHLQQSSAVRKTTVKKTAANAKAFESAILSVTGFKPETIESNSIVMPWLETKGSAMPDQLGREAFYDELYAYDPVNPDVDGEQGIKAAEEPEIVFRTYYRRVNILTNNPTFQFDVCPNPVIRSFELIAQLNLYKIRNCLNISGIERPLEAFAAPTDATSGVTFTGASGLAIGGTQRIYQASPYRFDFLIQRTKELNNIAQQIEGSFLAALEKLDDENYNVLRAKQDLQTAKSNIKLQELKIDEAESGIELAELQTDRSNLQIAELNKMIGQGLLSSEQALIGLYDTLREAEKWNATGSNLLSTANLGFSVKNAINNASNIFTGFSDVAALAILGGSGIAMQSIAQMTMANLRRNIGVRSLWASYERNVQRWNYEIATAKHDVKIGKQQEQIAKDRLEIVKQEKVIAELQQSHNEATIDYLLNQQFTNAALYEYMVGVLEKVYSYFLQEATAMAKLAKAQLTFERQQNVPDFIKGDYWVVSNNYGSNAEEEQDFKGITGSARLLQDVYRLEQHAQQTDQRKQQLRKTLSLASMSPMEFQQFRETGELNFLTTNELFDRDFPGHYLRLIKKVSTTVVALVPPVDGIKATLSSVGLSRVVAGGPIYQTLDIRRLPETVSLTSPVNDTGLLELEPENKMLKPFEGTGVETFWRFQMEKAANAGIDYSSIADVLITIDYEALNSFDYKAQVAQKLNRENSYEFLLPISLRTNLPDQWFDLANPEDGQARTEISFELDERILPANVSNASITNFMLYFSQDKEEKDVFTNVDISHTDENEAVIEATGVQSSDGKISSKTASALSELDQIKGTWKLSLNSDVQQKIENGELNDILFVFTIEGETPEYHLS